VSKARLVITAVLVEGRSIREVSAAYGVARSWIYELLSRYRVEGEAAFQPRSRRPLSQPAAIPAATVELIIQLRRALTRQGLDAGAHTLAWHLAEQHQLTVSEATIWRTLKRAGLITPEPKKKPKTAFVSFAAEQPNEMWQTDFTHYRLTRPDGSPGADVEILCFIDDHSRYAISVTCHQPVTGPTVVTAFQKAVADQGVPAAVLSDIQRHGLHHPLRRRPSRPPHSQRLPSRTPPPRHSAEHKHSRPNHPTTCGKVERFQQTLKKWLTAQPRQPQTLAELQALCDQFLTYYNNRRPHRSLGRQTPLAAYQARPKAAPPNIPDTQPQARVRRDIVDTDGKLSLRHAGRLHHIGIGRTHARTPILMLINGRHIRIIHASTGELIRELILNPAVDYQPQGIRKPRPKSS
jgi:transposase InsO family protein